MNFLEAKKALARFSGGTPLRIRLAASGNVEPLLLFVQALAAQRGFAAAVETLPFGTLGQSLLTPPAEGSQEVILLMPWDLVPECDWRSGVPRQVDSAADLLLRARGLTEQLKRRTCKLLYLPAPFPPLFLNPIESASLRDGLMELVCGLGAHCLDSASFALGNYFASGVPVAGVSMSDVAQAVVEMALGPVAGTSKVLVTDLDNVMWSGVIAEDGLDGIACVQEGKGFRHFVYQGLLANLKASGVLLAAVSRNDLPVALSPIESGRILLGKQDFVDILASYEPKSVHLRRLAERLNLGLDAFVFVDDNPIELAEVAAALPSVRCLPFPLHDDALPNFLHDLALQFARLTTSDEDRERTEFYRRRLEYVVASELHAETGDLSAFLADMQMKLTIYERTGGDCARAIQLINKTNQFNLNGRRVSEGEVETILSNGGHLYTAKLDDRAGSHGEILACLVDAECQVSTLVLSCRVFQRRVEHAFMFWLLRRLQHDLVLSYLATERNTPIREFLSDPAFAFEGDMVHLNGKSFLASNTGNYALFEVKEQAGD